MFDTKQRGWEMGTMATGRIAEMMCKEIEFEVCQIAGATAADDAKNMAEVMRLIDEINQVGNVAG